MSHPGSAFLWGWSPCLHVPPRYRAGLPCGLRFHHRDRGGRGRLAPDRALPRIGRRPIPRPGGGRRPLAILPYRGPWLPLGYGGRWRLCGRWRGWRRSRGSLGRPRGSHAGDKLSRQARPQRRERPHIQLLRSGGKGGGQGTALLRRLGRRLVNSPGRRPEREDYRTRTESDPDIHTFLL